MEHLLRKSKCSIFHNIFKYMIFERRQKALLWSKGLKTHTFIWVAFIKIYRSKFFKNIFSLIVSGKDAEFIIYTSVKCSDEFHKILLFCSMGKKGKFKKNVTKV